MKQIQVCIALSRNAARYLDFLISTLRETSDIDKFQFLLGINHGVSRVDIEDVVNKHAIDALIVDANPGDGYGSANHGASLDMIFSHVTSEYCIMADVDIAFTYKGWCEKFIERLVGDCVIIGTEYDGPKYLGFPNVICAMFKSAVVKSLGISFKPEGNYLQIDEMNAEIYGRSPGDSILLDTGSELPKKLKAAGYSGHPLRLFRSSSDEAVIVKGIRGEEYHLDGIPVLTHIGRSYTREFGKHLDALAWENAVRQFNK